MHQNLLDPMLLQVSWQQRQFKGDGVEWGKEWFGQGTFQGWGGESRVHLFVLFSFICVFIYLGITSGKGEIYKTDMPLLSPISILFLFQ